MNGYNKILSNMAPNQPMMEDVTYPQADMVQQQPQQQPMVMQQPSPQRRSGQLTMETIAAMLSNLATPERMGTAVQQTGQQFKQRAAAEDAQIRDAYRAFLGQQQQYRMQQERLASTERMQEKTLGARAEEGRVGREFEAEQAKLQIEGRKELEQYKAFVRETLGEKEYARLQEREDAERAFRAEQASIERESREKIAGERFESQAQKEAAKLEQTQAKEAEKAEEKKQKQSEDVYQREYKKALDDIVRLSKPTKKRYKTVEKTPEEKYNILQRQFRQALKNNLPRETYNLVVETQRKNRDLPEDQRVDIYEIEGMDRLRSLLDDLSNDAYNMSSAELRELIKSK